MRANRFRQIARAEKLAKPDIDVARVTGQKWLMALQGVVANAAILAFLIRYGNPQIGEPLSCACQRVSESDAFRQCCEKFPSLLRFGRHGQYSFSPHNRNRTFIIGTHLRHVVIGTFRGADEKEKLKAVFETAPPWLIWFTFGDYTAGLLGLTLPDLSGVTGFTRSKANFDLWYGLPSDAFEPEPWANGSENEPLARTDLNLVRPTTPLPDHQMTPREQKRARATYLKSHALKRTDDWPTLSPAKHLATAADDFLKLVGAPRSDLHPMWSAWPGARAKLGSLR